MNLIDIYSLMQAEELSEAQVCTALGMSQQQLRSRLTKWGHRLPLMLSVLDKIAQNKISRDGAAKALGITDRAVNKLSLSWRIKRPIPEYLVNRSVSKVKWEIRKKCAIDFIAGATIIKDAAESAEVTDRQMRRWVSELLDKHFGMVWKDLKTLTDKKRRRLASEIEDAENLDLAKQNVLNAIGRGDKSLQEEALERVVARKNRQAVNVRT